MKKIPIIFIFLLILIGLLIRNYHYQQVLFLDWDEGMYGQIAREMLRNKTIITTFNDHLWFDKPPLSYLLIALFFFVFGESEFWSRVVMIVVAIILLILLYLLTKKVTKNFIASLLPVFILSSSPIFLEKTTTLNSDLLVAISWVGYFLFFEKYWLKLLFLCLGVWGKSIVGYYPLLFEIIYHLFNIKRIKKINLIKLLFFIFLPSLWYLFSYLKFGNTFIYHHFVSQMFKRLYVPIELHFGNKFYYFNYLWQTLGFINFFILAGYLIYLKDLKSVFKNLKTSLILASPILFLFFLTLIKTKIHWYVIFFLPLLTLSIAVFFLKIKNKLLKNIVLVIITAFFIGNFGKNTFFLKIKYSPPEKLLLAKCLSKTNFNTYLLLVDEQERKNRNFLEAAHYDTTSSFLYGGSPSFVFYLNKKINFAYDQKIFFTKIKNYQAGIINKADLNQSGLKPKKIICQTENWLSFENIDFKK